MTRSVKRCLEWPQRPWLIWLLDTSKQAFSQVHSHFINVGMAILLAKEFSEDGCVWYLINIVLDSTLGTLLCYGVLHLVHLAARGRCPGLISGNYYHRETYRINCAYWLLQLLVWTLIVSLVSFNNPDRVKRSSFCSRRWRTDISSGPGTGPSRSSRWTRS